MYFSIILIYCINDQNLFISDLYLLHEQDSTVYNMEKNRRILHRQTVEKRGHFLTRKGSDFENANRTSYLSVFICRTKMACDKSSPRFAGGD